ncbi:hypothetical protein JOM56_013992 [Amanita muscaria]
MHDLKIGANVKEKTRGIGAAINFDPFLEKSGLVPKNEELVNYLSNHYLYTRPIQYNSHEVWVIELTIYNSPKITLNAEFYAVKLHRSTKKLGIRKLNIRHSMRTWNEVVVVAMFFSDINRSVSLYHYPGHALSSRKQKSEDSPCRAKRLRKTTAEKLDGKLFAVLIQTTKLQSTDIAHVISIVCAWRRWAKTKVVKELQCSNMLDTRTPGCSSANGGKRKRGHTNIANSRGSTSVLAPATFLPKQTHGTPQCCTFIFEQGTANVPAQSTFLHRLGAMKNDDPPRENGTNYPDQHHLQMLRRANSSEQYTSIQYDHARPKHNDDLTSVEDMDLSHTSIAHL